MSTTKKTTNQYAPAGMSAYNQMTPAMQQNMMQFMQNPMQSSFFNTNLQAQQKQIGQSQQGNMNTFLNNMRQIGGGGGGGSNPFMTSQMAMMGRAGTGMQQNAFTSLLNNANQLRFGATQGAAGYQPLQTGQSQTTTGLGTWLPQVAGGALSAASSFGGAGGAGGGGGLPTLPTQAQSASSTWSPFLTQTGTNPYAF